MPASRAALRAGLIGGLVIGLAVVAQQMANTAELRMLGLLITFGGLAVVGLFAARDAWAISAGAGAAGAVTAGASQRVVSVRAGAIAGLVAGLVAALAVVGMLLVLSMNGEFAMQVQDALQQLYTPEQMRLIEEAGLTLDELAQMTALMQMMCCGAGLPIIGLICGAFGGSMAAGLYRQGGRSG